MSNDKIFVNQFAEDVEKGFTAAAKYISSKYFYDAAGDAIFQKIMRLPEYYLTNAESEIFRLQAANIIRDAALKDGVQLIELGAGDGTKTKLLLKELLKSGIHFSYHPIDISSHVLDELVQNMKLELGDALNITAITGDYFEAFQSSDLSNKKQKFVLFLGSTVGNFGDDNGAKFISRIASNMQADDQLMIGFDLKKDPQVILSAYNDSAGITRAFNLNLLLRINRELDANFDIGQFNHYPIYDPELGAAKSYLVSKKIQTVKIGALDKSFTFEAGETIFTEISRKYQASDITSFASAASLSIKKTYYDSKGYFADVLMQK